MFLTSFRRSSSFRRYIKAIGIIIPVLCFLDLILLTSTRQSSASMRDDLLPQEKAQKIYIASIHWNNEEIIRSNWTNAVLELAETLGPENVYISIYESGSWDDSKGALKLLDAELEQRGVQRTITLEPRTHVEEIAAPPASSGWIDTPRGQKELRRIPYLSRLRNLSLKPLADLALNGITFDRVLFLNDVVFTVGFENSCECNLVLTIGYRSRLKMCRGFLRPETAIMLPLAPWTSRNHQTTTIPLLYGIIADTKP